MIPQGWPRWTRVVALPAALLLAGPAGAQLADVRPGDEKIELPPFEEAPPPGQGTAPLLELPEVPSFTPPPRPRGSVLPPLELVVAFYTALKEPGVSKAEAVRRAQLKLTEDPRFAHPFYWSPFLLISNWL